MYTKSFGTSKGTKSSEFNCEFVIQKVVTSTDYIMMTSWDHLINTEILLVLSSVAATCFTIAVDTFFSGRVNTTLLLVMDQN